MGVLRPDGTARVRLISPGHGSSGYYSESLLQRVAPRFTDAFMYWDHATAQEDAARPEGSLRSLAGKIVGTPTYEATNPHGAGLYADVKVYDTYRAAVESMGTDIGISIRALGKSRAGVAPDGKKTNLIEDIVVARSADWVTAPGANGRAIELFESARNGPSAPPIREVRTVAEPNPTLNPLPVVESATLEQFGQIQETLRQVQEDNRRMRERETLREGQDLIQRALARYPFHELTRTRLAETLVARLPLTADGSIDTAALQTQVTEAAQREAQYLTQVGGAGAVRNLGPSVDPEELTEAKADEQLDAALSSLWGAPAGARGGN